MFISGCRYEPIGKPSHFPTTRLSGRVTLAGKPIPKGWVSLFPLGSTLGEPLLVPIEEDGNYSTEKAPIGPLAVRVTLPKSDMEAIKKNDAAIANRLETLGGLKSPLRVETKSDSNNRFDVDLLLPPPSS
jgi:hypothetical protein